MNIQIRPGYPNNNPNIDKAEEASERVSIESNKIAELAKRYDNVDGYDTNPDKKKVNMDWKIKGNEVKPGIQLDTNGNQMASETDIPDKTIKGYIEYADDWQCFPLNMDVEIMNSAGELTTIKSKYVKTYPAAGSVEYQENLTTEYKSKDLNFKSVLYDDRSEQISIDE